jgi:hypothetical protein
MSHGPEHQLEHAEHAAHASLNDFDKRVTISIAIIAAVLACVTMLGHRAHNDTLSLQSEVGIQKVEASNTWARYQAVNGRSHLYQSVLEISDFVASRAETQSQQAAARQRWGKQVKKYEEDQMPTLMKEAEAHLQKSEQARKESEEMHARSNRFDLGELGLQLGTVLASPAILTKARPFWFGGILCAVVGAVVAATGYLGLFLGGHH